MRARAFLSAIFVASTLTGAAQAVPIVDRVPDALDPQACDGQGCWTNHLRVTDLDGDGDLDILLVNYADFFGGSGAGQPLVVYQNDGAGHFVDVSETTLGGHVGAHRQVAVGDVEGDGDLDLYAPTGDGSPHALFINEGDGTFSEQAERLPAISPRSGAARMGDVDGDLDLDIFVADGYAAAGPPFGHVYLNDGAGIFTEKDGAVPSTIAGSDVADVELLDVDGDFDLDVIVSAHAGGTGALWLNDGAGSFVAGGSLAPPGSGSQYHYDVTPCDVDADGDLDLWIDNTGGSYREQLQINDGSGNFTDETSARVVGNAAGSDDNGVVCADVDSDGDLDAIVLSLSSPERLLENDGTGNFTLVEGAFPAPTDCTLWGEVGDLDGDGRLDLVTGQGECSSSDEVYLGNDDMAVDEQPPTIRAIREVPDAAQDAPAFAAFAVVDADVTDEGPRLSRAYAVLDPDGAATEVDATFIGGDMYGVSLPTSAVGTTTYTVCAVDRQDLTTCSAQLTYVVGEGPGTGGGGAGGAAGATTTGSTTTGTGGGSSDGGGPGHDGGSSAGGSGSSDGGGSSAAGGSSVGAGDGGCGCHMVGGGDAPTDAHRVLLTAIAAAVVVRARRPERRRSS